MAKDLTNSRVDRQTILDQDLLIAEIQTVFGLACVSFKGDSCLTESMAASFFRVPLQAVESCVREHADELTRSGYEVLTGNRLQAFREAVRNSDIPGLPMGEIGNAEDQTAIFSFKAFLNLGMLLTEGETAGILRQVILDTAMDSINQKTGGGTKYLDQKDGDFAEACLQEAPEQRGFTEALRDCVDMGTAKYEIYTAMVYRSLFQEQEYREALRRQSREPAAAYECGLAARLTDRAAALGRRLTNWEANEVFREFEELPEGKTLILQAKMAGGEMVLQSGGPSEGPGGDLLERLMQENQDVLRRLKERG